MEEEDVFVDDDMAPDVELNRITNAISGAAIEVHRALGPGFSDSAYCNALGIEFTFRNIRYQPQCPVEVIYRGQQVGQGKMDFLVEGNVILEVKAVEALSSVHTAQVISYLRATNHKLALLLNFNVRRLKDGIKRVAA